MEGDGEGALAEATVVVGGGIAGEAVVTVVGIEVESLAAGGGGGGGGARAATAVCAVTPRNVASALFGGSGMAGATRLARDSKSAVSASSFSSA